jgi:hypothetical protein
MVYDLTKCEGNEVKLFFNMGGEGAERHGSVCNFWCNMKRGSSNRIKQFGRQQHMETPAFMADVKHIISYLSGNDMESPPLRSPQDFTAFCRVYGGFAMENYDVDAPSTFGLKIISDGYSYYLRCHPDTGLFYIYAYDNRYLLPELAGKHDSVKACYSILPSTGEIIFIRRGEQGYIPSSYQGGTRELSRFFVDRENLSMGISRAQEEALLAGSIFGWNTPAAKPWNYNQDGTPRATPPKNRDAR